MAEKVDELVQQVKKTASNFNKAVNLIGVHFSEKKYVAPSKPNQITTDDVKIGKEIVRENGDTRQKYAAQGPAKLGDSRAENTAEALINYAEERQINLKDFIKYVGNLGPAIEVENKSREEKLKDKGKELEQYVPDALLPELRKKLKLGDAEVTRPDVRIAAAPAGIGSPS